MQKGTFRADERLNQINDRDDMWGPLLFLRPEQHQLMSPARVLLICVILGMFYGMIGNVAIALLAKASPGWKPPVYFMPALLTGMYYVCGQLSLFAAWNRRAPQVSRRMDWAELSRRTPPPAREDEHEAQE